MLRAQWDPKRLMWWGVPLVRIDDTLQVCTYCWWNRGWWVCMYHHAVYGWWYSPLMRVGLWVVPYFGRVREDGAWRWNTTCRDFQGRFDGPVRAIWFAVRDSLRRRRASRSRINEDLEIV